MGVYVVGACVVGSMHGRGHAWRGGMFGKGAYVARRPCMGGRSSWQRGAWLGLVWQERRPLQRMVHILLECILVIECHCILNFEYLIFRTFKIYITIKR